DNAVKWSPPDGTVTVRLRRDQVWSLYVLDQGPGIAEADLPYVFDRFYRAEGARSLPGSGLGLAIVQQVIVSHGGTVSAIAPPTGGTLVHIELPIVAEHEPGADVEQRLRQPDEPGLEGTPTVEPASAAALAWGPDPASGPNPYGNPAAPWGPD